MRKFLLIIILLFCNNIVLAADFQTFKLNNGQTVIIKEVKENPIVIIDTWIKTGSINETDKNNGVAHFLEHMFFKGTNKFSAGEFDKILESKGAITNAATSKDFTHYYITVPSKDFDVALEMHADMLLNPLIPRVELEQERKVVLEEIAKNEDSPQRVLYKNLISQIYKTHPYKREVIGTKNVIETITREEMLEFYNRYYVPQNMTTIIVGDVNTQETIDKINKFFNQPPSKKLLTKNIKEKPLLKTSEITEKADVNTAYMMVGFNGVNAKNQKDNYTLDVLATILGDGITSRLYKSLKDEKHLVQSISAYNSSSREDGLFIISANFEPQNIDEIKKSIIKEIQTIKNTPPSIEELNKAFNIIERDTFYSRESISNIASEIGYIKTIFDDLNMYDNYIKEIKRITTQQIQLAAKKFLDTNKMAISIVLPKDFVLPETKKTADTNLIPVESKLISESNSIKKYILPNGATILVNNNTSNDIIAIEIYAKGGKLIENIPGTSSLLAPAMLKGTKKYTKDEFATILEEKGIKLSANDGTEAFTISLKTTKNELDVALDLLNEILNNALLENATIDKVKTEKLYSFVASRDNPFYIAIEEFKEMIYQNTKYKNTTTKQQEKFIPVIKQSDVINYYNNIFNSKNILISINGNISQQQEKLFRFFNNAFTPSDMQEFNISKYANTIEKISRKEKETQKDTKASWLVLGWQTDGLVNEKDYVTLKVINSLLGSGMSSRLFTNLRNKQGLAYQIGSSYSANTNLGFFITYIGTKPSQVTYAKDEILKEINKLKNEFVMQEELQSAKDKLIGNFILSQETNSEKAKTLGEFEVTNLGYDFINRYPSLVQEVTSNDVIKIANKYFTNSYIYSLVTP